MILTTLSFLLCLLSFSSGQQQEVVYALRVLPNNTILDVVSTPPARGYMTLVLDLTQYRPAFPKAHPDTAYDPNLNMFIFGNVDPPLIALVETYSKGYDTIELPSYGSVLAFTAYDGILYVLQGLDEDVPNLGRLVSVDLNNNKINFLFKFKLPEGVNFVVGAPFVFIPEDQSWLIALDEHVLQITDTGIKPTGVRANFTSMWKTADAGVFGYMQGGFYGVDIESKKTKPITFFPCHNGVPSLNPTSKKVYHVQNCTGLLEVVIGDLSNATLKSVHLDPRLAEVVSAQVSGTYVPYQCGASCNTHPDCGNSTSCSTCRVGKCVSSGDCGSFCQTGADCFAGVCAGNCESGRCGNAGCGNDCKNHEDCKLHSPECQICRLGKCVADGECGSYCLTSLDCYGGACLNNCVNWRCAESPKK